RTLDKETLESKVLSELQGIAGDLGVEGHQRLRKADLIQAIVTASNGKSSGGSTKTESKTATKTETEADTEAAPSTDTKPELEQATSNGDVSGQDRTSHRDRRDRGGDRDGGAGQGRDREDRG